MPEHSPREVAQQQPRRPLRPLRLQHRETLVEAREESGEIIKIIAQEVRPVFLGHGDMDPVVGLALGAMSREWLQRAGYSVAWHSYPMPHSLCAEEIRDIADFMQPILLATH